MQHIGQVMEDLVSQAESARHLRASRSRRNWCSSPTRRTRRRAAAAPRPRSIALRQVFGEAADQIVIANTKGFTGHAMATGIEDVVAVKALETGMVPPVANFKEVDPELGTAEPVQGRHIPSSTRCAWARASVRRSA